MQKRIRRMMKFLIAGSGSRGIFLKKTIILGIEGTAWNFSAAVVDQDDVIAEATDTYRPPQGGIHPREAGQHHASCASSVIGDLFRQLEEKGYSGQDIDAVAFSKGPGLGPCLRVTATVARMVALMLGKPLIGVNHCVAHIEIGIRNTPATDPVVLYVSGANSQVLAYKQGRYRVFGETLDIGLGNSLDKFSRTAGLTHPGGPKIEAFAKEADSLPELPYTVKGMDFFFSGLSAAASRALAGKDGRIPEGGPDHQVLCNVCHAYQETAFAMAAEVTERALAHTGKSEVLLAGGVGANMRLREMLRQMCDERGAAFYVPEKKYMGDNGVMIACTGLLMYQAGDTMTVEESHIDPSFRPDQVSVTWKQEMNDDFLTDIRKMQNGAEAVVRIDEGEDDPYSEKPHLRKVVIKERVSKGYRDPRLDERLRKERTRTEARMLSEARRAGVPTPIVYQIDDFALRMQHIEGLPLKFVIDEELAEETGRLVGKLHDADIIHGDLTTSNIICRTAADSRGNQVRKLYFIDFGLAVHDSETEAKGVDVNVLFRTFESTHDEPEKLIAAFSAGYAQTYSSAGAVLKRVGEIRLRGRYS